MHSWHSIRQGCIIFFQAQSLLILFNQQSYIAFFLNLWLTARTEGWEKKIWKNKDIFFFQYHKKRKFKRTFLLLFVVQAKKSISHICCLWSRCDLDLVCCISSGRRTGVHFHDREYTPVFFWALMFLAQLFQGMTIVNIIFVDTKSFSWR